MESKTPRRRGTPIPVAPPRVPTPMPSICKGGFGAVGVVSRPATSDRSGSALVQRHQTYEHGSCNMMKVATPHMDRNGYFGYVAATAKKKKIGLMQSGVPRLAYTGDEGRPERERSRRPSEAPRATLTCSGGAFASNANSSTAPYAAHVGRVARNDAPRRIPADMPRISHTASLECYQPKYHHLRRENRPDIATHNYAKSDTAQYHQDPTRIHQVKKHGHRSDSGSDYAGRTGPHGSQFYSAGSAAQASAAAAFFARSAQKNAEKSGGVSSPHRRRKASGDEESPAPGGYYAALHRAQPPAPPALLRRIGGKELTGVGKVKVMLRVSGGADATTPTGGSQILSLDRRKKQATLYEPASSPGTTAPAPDDRRVGVAAPKMFAFDAIFSSDDSQTEVCSSALTDVIHAVINGIDGCLFCFGHAGLGKSYTMLGSSENASTFGSIPCAISWLFRGIAEQRQKCGTRFSVRVSAIEVCGNTNQLKDLLSGYASDSEQSPGVYLRDDPLLGTQLQNHSELRVQNAEKAAFYLDAALAKRGPGKEEGKDSHLLYTLHVYQYSIGGKGAVAGGRSRLHLIDLGNSDRGKSNGGIPLSGIGNILLAIFNGQRHLPYREHNVTHVLRECLGSLTCHTAMIVHVSPKEQNYTDTLATLQLASRIHRMRRRKIKFPQTTNAGSGGSSGEDAKATTSTEPDPSSSDLSADTVIYVGPSDDATDGEHPPVYIPSINSGDNRCAMGKVLRGSSAEKHHKIAGLVKIAEEKSPSHKINLIKSPAKSMNNPVTQKSPSHIANVRASPKGSPSKVPVQIPVSSSDEQWIDGPRISKHKVAEARYFIKDVSHAKKKETWIDGPLQATKLPLQTELLNSHGAENIGYGYMDTHKKNMIRKWVENQTVQMSKTKHTTNPKQTQNKNAQYKELTQFKTDDADSRIEPPVREVIKGNTIEESVIRTGLKKSSHANAIKEEEFDRRKVEDEDDDSEEMAEIPPALPLIQPLSSREVSMESLDSRIKERLRLNDDSISNQSRDTDINDNRSVNDEDDDILEIIEVEESLEPVPMQDCCLQVTEEDIAFCMGIFENPLPEVDQSNDEEHPLRILSQENLTVVSTFTDSLSVYSDMERQVHNNSYLKAAININDDDYYNPNLDDRRKNNYDIATKKFEQLAKLHELYQSKLALANVTISPSYREYSEPNLKFSPSNLQSYSMTDMYVVNDFHGNSSIYSEPPYKPHETFCDNCKMTMSRPGSAMNWNELNFSSSIQDVNCKLESTPFDRVSTKDLRIASLRHPDGASNPNLKEEKRLPGNGASGSDQEELYDESKKASLHLEVRSVTELGVDKTKPLHILAKAKETSTDRLNQRLMGLSNGLVSSKVTVKPDGYDSGHDSTPRTSKHSPAAISRRAESGYDSVVRDSESSSIDSYSVRKSHRSQIHGGNRASNSAKYKHHQHDRSFCSWLRNPFTCKYADTDAEISDF